MSPKPVAAAGTARLQRGSPVDSAAPTLLIDLSGEVGRFVAERRRCNGGDGGERLVERA